MKRYSCFITRLLLKSLGMVTIQKLDPYLNVDPGTNESTSTLRSFILDDGSETDLDLGHYERFIDESLTNNNTTSSEEYTGMF